MISFESKNALQVHACYLVHSRLRQLFKYVMHFLVLIHRDKTLNASVATDDFSLTTKRWSKLKSWADLSTFGFFCAWKQVSGISLAFPFMHRIFARRRPKPVKCAVTPCIPTSCSPLCDNILGNVNGSTDYVVSFLAYALKDYSFGLLLLHRKHYLVVELVHGFWQTLYWWHIIVHGILTMNHKFYSFLWRSLVIIT